MGLAKRLRDDEVREEPADRLFPRPSEDDFGLPAPIDHDSVTSHDDDAIQRRLQHKSQDLHALHRRGRPSRRQWHETGLPLRIRPDCSTGSYQQGLKLPGMMIGRAGLLARPPPSGAPATRNLAIADSMT